MDADTALAFHQEFAHLNLADLLLARERNHLELMRKKYVIGTAIGLYLIRKSDPPSRRVSKRERPPRTLENSEVRDSSWPCILVFVEQWKPESELNWLDRVPPSVYLDEHRKVPTCVVYAPKVDVVETPMRNVVYPCQRIGGGFPVIAEVQGREHIASVGCMLRDGHTIYALTNRHVTGPAGEIVYGRLAGEKMRIGESSFKQLTRMLFPEVYPGWAGKDTWVNLDVGLIRVDDVNQWSASVYGIGTMGPIADLGTDNLTLRLIDTPVRAYGCGSGQMKGRIKALFYRFKSLGGFDYVSDFLIGPREAGGNLATHPGDSGTVWLLESKENGLMPIALQWGGQVFASDGGAQQRSSYALATCLSTVCNILNVDVIRDWNLSTSEYWGEVGHFAIAGLSCTLKFTGLPGLQRLMSRNIEQVAFAVKDLRDPDKIIRSRAHFDFVPLADVADDVWRTTRTTHGETGDDGNNHFADMDQKATSGPFKNKTLLDLCEDPAKVDPAVWVQFYQSMGEDKMGALPFRVWQGYNLMVDAAKAKDPLTFVCVAGCMAHYVGDACQPLHISRLHHGFPENATSTSKKVHSVYETDMLNRNTSEIVDGVAALLKSASVSGSFSGGHGAAVRVVKLMKDTVKALPPEDIVNAYNEETTPADRVKRLFDDFGEKTIELMAAGSVALADIWAAAWKEGSGEDIASSALVALDQGELATLYRRSDFYPSMSLESMVPLLTPDGDGAPARRPARGRRQPAARGGRGGRQARGGKSRGGRRRANR